MKNRLPVFLLALLGILGSGRLADAQPESRSPGGPLPSDKAVPPIDAAPPARLSTATFALG
jgi:hypothetical protein